MTTDIDREIGRFEDFLDDEGENLTTLSFEELDDKLSDWMDSLDIPIKFHEEFKNHLLQNVIGEDQLGKKTEAKLEEEAEQVVKAVVMKTNRRWTKRETDRLKNLYKQGRAVSYIQKLLGRSASSIYHKASRAGTRRTSVRERKNKVSEVV